MDALNQIFDFLNNGVVKMVMVLIATFVLRKWPNFVNEAAPGWTLISSIVLTILGYFTQGTTPAVVPAVFSSASDVHLAGIFSGGGFFDRILHEAFIPWLMGYGAQRGGDHMIVWKNGKSRADVVVEKKEEPPIVIKPFQTMVK